MTFQSRELPAMKISNPYADDVKCGFSTDVDTQETGEESPGISIRGSKPNALPEKPRERRSTKWL